MDMNLLYQRPAMSVVTVIMRPDTTLRFDRPFVPDLRLVGEGGVVRFGKGFGPTNHVTNLAGSTLYVWEDQSLHCPGVIVRNRLY